MTDGLFDLRPYVGHYGLPARMDGMRALEVGTWDARAQTLLSALQARDYALD